jgi:hypothetical protein
LASGLKNCEYCRAHMRKVDIGTPVCLLALDGLNVSGMGCATRVDASLPTPLDGYLPYA